VEGFGERVGDWIVWPRDFCVREFWQVGSLVEECIAEFDSAGDCVIPPSTFLSARKARRQGQGGWHRSPEKQVSHRAFSPIRNDIASLGSGFLSLIGTAEAVPFPVTTKIAPEAKEFEIPCGLGSWNPTFRKGSERWGTPFRGGSGKSKGQRRRTGVFVLHGQNQRQERRAGAPAPHTAHTVLFSSGGGGVFWGGKGSRLRGIFRGGGCRGVSLRRDRRGP
jgi:hypothetical protein